MEKLKVLKVLKKINEGLGLQSEQISLMSGLAANIKIKTIFCFQTDYFNHETLHSLTDQIFKQIPCEKLGFRKVNDCLICFSTYGLENFNTALDFEPLLDFT